MERAIHVKTTFKLTIGDIKKILPPEFREQCPSLVYSACEKITTPSNNIIIISIEFESN